MDTANVIPDRIADSLAKYPPFSMLRIEEVKELARRARVRALAAGESLFRQGDPPPDEALFLESGRVEYHWASDGKSELVDVRDVGDLIGLTAILESSVLRVTAMVVEDCLFYTLEASLFRRLIERNDAARNYARRHMFWATRVGGKVSVPEEARLHGKRALLQSYFEGAQVVRPRSIDRLLTCQPDESLEAASAMMVARRVPSILVTDAERRPLGVVTSISLLKEIVVAGGSAARPVAQLMASPVFTVAPGSSAAAAILLMLRERVGQVCVTEDGTAETKALDVCTYKDLMAQASRHPAVFLNEMRRARTLPRLREICDEVEHIGRSYLQAGVSGILVGQIFAELYDVLIERLIGFAIDELADQGLSLPLVDWAWISVGSDGRREQILRTDMDNAFVFSSSGDQAEDERLRTRFTHFAEAVVSRLVDCGFSRCQGGVMASNPRWCRSDAEWIAEVDSLDIASGEAMLRIMILLDLRFVAGDRDLCATLRRALMERASANRYLLRRLAEHAVETPPPLNFFGKFVVEKKGSNAGEFDVKGRVLAPLRDMARTLALKRRLTAHYSTGGRLEELAATAPDLKEVAEHAYGAYDFLLRLRNLTGLERSDSGRYIQPARLSKLERAQLANVFDVVRMAQFALRREFHLEASIR